MQTIVMLKALSQYDVLRYFVDDLANAFEKINYEVQIIDLVEENWTEKLVSVLQTKKISFFLGMNAVGVDLASDGRSLYDLVGAPFFAFLVDHPMYHLPRLKDTTSNEIIVSCMDAEHISYIDNMAPEFSRKFMRVFVPHGAPINHEDLDNSEVERPIDILFAGSFTDPDEIRNTWKQSFPYMGKIADSIIEFALHDQEKPFHNVVEQVLNEKGISFADSQLMVFWNLMTSVDLYIRNKIRMDIISQLHSLPAKVDVYGNGWDKLKLHTNKSVRFYQPLSFTEVQEKMKQSKMTLNVIPSIRNGAHERIFTSMLMGSAALSTSNSYLRKNFEHGSNIILFESKQDLSSIVVEYLEDRVKLQEIAQKGKETALLNHTWQNRARDIIEFIEMFKLCK